MPSRNYNKYYDRIECHDEQYDKYDEKIPNYAYWSNPRCRDGKWHQFCVWAFRNFYSELSISGMSNDERFVRAIYMSRDDAIPKKLRTRAITAWLEGMQKIRTDFTEKERSRKNKPSDWDWNTENNMKELTQGKCQDVELGARRKMRRGKKYAEPDFE